jgi:hypothetical protein
MGVSRPPVNNETLVIRIISEIGGFDTGFAKSAQPYSTTEYE